MQSDRAAWGALHPTTRGELHRCFTVKITQLLSTEGGRTERYWKINIKVQEIQRAAMLCIGSRVIIQSPSMKYLFFLLQTWSTGPGFSHPYCSTLKAVISKPKSHLPSKEIAGTALALSASEAVYHKPSKHRHQESGELHYPPDSSPQAKVISFP